MAHPLLVGFRSDFFVQFASALAFTQRNNTSYLITYNYRRMLFMFYFTQTLLHDIRWVYLVLNNNDDNNNNTIPFILHNNI